MTAIVPLTIRSETVTVAGLHVNPHAPSAHDLPPDAATDVPNMIDVDEGVHVHVFWDKAGTPPLSLALYNAACKWDGKAVLASVEGGPSKVVEVNDQTFANSTGVETMLFNFPAGTVTPGLYKLYARVNLNGGGDPAQNRGANMSIEGPLLQFYDAP